MPAPTFDLPVFGSAPNQYSTEQTFEGAINAVIAALYNDVVRNGGKSFASREEAVSFGQENLPGTLSRIFTANGDFLELRGSGNNTVDPLFEAAPYWGVLERYPRRALLANGLRDYGIIQLVNVAGTGDAITADIGALLVAAGVTALSTSSEVEYIPSLTNAAANPTMTIGGVTFGIRNADGGTWPAGGFVVGRSYKLRRRNAVLRVAAGDATSIDLADGRMYALMAASSPSAAVGIPQGTNVVASVHNGSGLIRYWRVSGAPSGGVETESVKMSADGRWWTLLGDAGVSDLSAGRLYYLNAANSPSSAVVPATATMVVSVNIGAGLSREWRYRLAPADGLETENLVQSADGRWWERVKEAETLAVRTDLTAAVQQEIADRAADTAGIRNGDLLTDGGVAIIGVDGAGDLMRAYPNGLDFIPSPSLIARIGAGGVAPTDGWAPAVDGSFTAQAGQHGVMAVDRFTDRADGVRLPVSVVNGVSRKAVIFSVYGQSNGDVTRIAAEPLMWETPPFPYHAFMLDDMNAFGSGTHRGGMMGWQGVAVPRGTRMINASEALRGCQSYASAAFSRLMMWDGPLRRTGLIRSSAWGGNALIGSAAGAGIWKDSNGAYTQSWLNWSGDIQQAHDLLTAEGYEVEAVYICFTHQEADWQTPRATYLANFLAMKAEREALIDAAMPGIRVHWFCDQASGSGYRTGSYLGGRWPSRMAIADACQPENGGDNITMVMPRYWMTMAQFADLTYETIHHSYRARVWQGEMYAHAMRAVELGQQWRCPIMSGAAISGNDVIVDFDSLAPLMIDQTFCKVRPDAGFTVNQGAIAVTGVQQTGQRQITLTCGAAPTGSVEYAYRQQDGQDVADEWPIATGAIRDAWEAPSAFDPGKKLVRAALGSQLTL